MDTDPAPTIRNERIVDWRALGRRAQKPMPWLAVAALTVIGFLVLEAYAWKPAGEGRSGHEERFRFDGVYIVERGAEGNISRFAISPWFSNPGAETARDLRFVVYAVESSRRISSSVAETQIGDLRPLRTQNATVDFQLNNTRNYSIEILVLEGDYLIARGYGAVGWVYLHDYDESTTFRLRVSSPSSTLTAGDFTYEYPGR